jgi:hypothetical protein
MESNLCRFFWLFSEAVEVGKFEIKALKLAQKKLHSNFGNSSELHETEFPKSLRKSFKSSKNIRK